MFTAAHWKSSPLTCPPFRRTHEKATLAVKRLLEFHDRSVWYIAGSRPAVFYLADHEGGGVLINTPPFDTELAVQLAAITPVKFLFFPSRFGAIDVDRWRADTQAQAMAYGVEARKISGTIDKVLDREARFSRTIDFLPMSGRTESSATLRCKNKPGIMFFGPILECNADGVPSLQAHADDYSWENRLFGALGLQDLKYEYAFTDDFSPATSLFGPGIDALIHHEIDQMIDA